MSGISEFLGYWECMPKFFELNLGFSMSYPKLRSGISGSSTLRADLGVSCSGFGFGKFYPNLQTMGKHQFSYSLC
jgi:hypothetical protein